MDAQGACVCVRAAAHLARAPATKLYAPAPPAGGVLARPTLVSFSPCGYTLLAYFPLGTAPARAGVLAPCTGLTTPIALETGASPTALGGTPASVGTSAWHAEQGVVCVWTCTADVWTLRQALPVCDAESVPTAQALHGHVVDVCWLGTPRAWACDAPLDAESVRLVRAPASGPAGLLALPRLPLDRAQDEQAALLFTSTGQVSYWHRLPTRTPSAFRVHHGWLAEPSVLPPPATLEHSAGERCDAWVRRVSCLAARAVPEEEAVLVAYTAHDAPGIVHVTQLQFAIDGEMSFVVVRALAPLPLATTGLRVDARVPGTPRLAHIAWVQSERDLELLLALDVHGGTQLVAWTLQRTPPASASPAPDWVRRPLTQYLLPRATAFHPAAHVSALVAPAPRTVYAGVVRGDDEAWAGVALDTLALSARVHAPLPRAARRRTRLAVSPLGVLACAALRPSGALALVALPVPAAPLARCAGRLVALALLQRTSCADVAVWARAHAPLLDALPAVMLEAAHVLALAHTPTLAQQLRLCEAARELDAHGAVHRRAACLLHLAALHARLAGARTDGRSTPFSACLAADAAVAFAPSQAWRLADGLQHALALLAAAARHAVVRDADTAPPADPLLELLVFGAPARLLGEVLAGFALFAAHVEHVALAEFARGRTDPAQLRASCRSAADELAAVRALVRAATAHAPVDLRAAAAAFAAHAPPDTPWTVLFAPPAAHGSEAARALAHAVRALVARPAPLWAAAPELLRPASLLLPS